jgi:DNA-binding transcriptional ArsR family regulator
MTYAKVDLFDVELQKLAELAKILSHPARLAILKYLAETRVCISGDISNELPLSRTTVSQHLQELKKAGLIKRTIEGVRINYCLDHTMIKESRNILDKYMKSVDCDNC